MIEIFLSLAVIVLVVLLFLERRKLSMIKSENSDLKILNAVLAERLSEREGDAKVISLLIQKAQAQMDWASQKGEELKLRIEAFNLDIQNQIQILKNSKNEN